MICNGLCQYYETYSGFARNRTYEDYKSCTVCNHIVPRENFECERCYCCNGRYRVSSRYNRSRILRLRHNNNKQLNLLSSNHDI